MTRWQTVKQFFKDWAYISSGAAQIDAISSIFFTLNRQQLEDSIKLYARHGMYEDAAKAEAQLRELLQPNGSAR